ncbi:hypothetical protein ACTXK7_07315 [Vreelandella alkaliphila]|uniref:hypothetical protein n=1 Tax=Halomonadaceae TaxID=28256 RepID=UPI003CF0AD07
MTEQRKSEEIPFTIELLHLCHIMHTSRSIFISESSIAEGLGLPAPKDWDTRCRELFFRQYADICDRIGLKRNEITYRTIAWDSHNNTNLMKELDTTSADDLPKRFSFEPWGGIKRVSTQDNAGGV